MQVVCCLSVFWEPFTDCAFGFPHILFFTFFTFDHICKVSRITGYMLFYLSCFAGVAKSVRSSCIVNVRAGETSMSGVAAESTRDMSFGVVLVFFSFARTKRLRRSGERR